MQKIKVANAKVKQGNVIESEFFADQELEKYFTDNTLLVEYEESIAELPQSILNVPVFYNLLPVALFLDITLEFDELDRGAFESVSKIREGYQQIYPELVIAGDVKAKKLVDHRNDSVNQKSGMLFTGGVDSTASLIEHISEKPETFTVWGADIAQENVVGWQIVKTAIERNCQQNNLKSNFVKSNFKDLMVESKLNQEIRESFGWWHDAHHSLGLSGIWMPVLYKHAVSLFYIPGTHDINFNPPVASDPRVDNHITCAGLKVYHDLFEQNRQMKTEMIVNYAKQNKAEVNLRVCWEGDGGVNCHKCEKCARTIVNIILAGGDPRKFGFSDYNENLAKNIIKNFKQGFYHIGKATLSYQYSIIQEAANRGINDSLSKESAKLIEFIKNFDRAGYLELQDSFGAKLNRVARMKIRNSLDKWVK